ncbi:SAM-dependent methyltransferase [cf. Phormidesmis sp. LEGE 11477]|uniref:class I SAM-dependent methyltransferase n=1 Tax=cf. Phormidesmis sp. LEGE 11477 TaxID=1828680 RepID=UPI00187E1206|nr:SAM-dependent methyltransferase [cf. Phormidesmis sp. LEGE 11477]MBE9064401.1 SAM-dependent methyltransferase [cf. Phormidesmis sp. LEGE 11477]
MERKDFSLTALVPLWTRWMLHWQGSRSDGSTARLVQALFGQSYGWLCAGAGPILLAMRLSDWLAIAPLEKPTLASMLSARTFFFDKALTAALASVEQVVILGAGFDTRLFELCKSRELGLFEVDRIETQTVKRQALEKSGIDVGEVNFVAVDFACKSWTQVLVSNGFDPRKRTFFLWEGVTYYLSAAEIRQGFVLIDEVCGEGSVIAFDFFSEALVGGEGIVGIGRAALDFIGEPLRFGVNVSRGIEAGLSELMVGTGLALDSVQVVDSWIGEKPMPGSTDVLGGFAIARKQNHRTVAESQSK